MNSSLFSKVEPLLVPFRALSEAQQAVLLKLSTHTFAALPSTLSHLAPLQAAVPENYCAVPFFGNIETATVATFSLNPSNAEFWGDNSIPLPRHEWRFDVSTPDDRIAVYHALLRYFQTKPLPWFSSFSHVHEAFALACSPDDQRSGRCVHLDVLPWATARKWVELTEFDHATLAPLRVSAAALVDLIDASRITDFVVTSANESNPYMRAFCQSFDRRLLHQTPMKQGLAYSSFSKQLPSGRVLRVLGLNQATNYLNKLAGLQLEL